MGWQLLLQAERLHAEFASAQARGCCSAARERVSDGQGAFDAAQQPHPSRSRRQRGATHVASRSVVWRGLGGNRGCSIAQRGQVLNLGLSGHHEDERYLKCSYLVADCQH